MAGEAGLVIGTAFFGIEGNCFFAEARRGLVRSSPLKVLSSVSDLLRTEPVDMLQKGFITCIPNKGLQFFCVFSVSSGPSDLYPKSTQNEHAF